MSYGGREIRQLIRGRRTGAGRQWRGQFIRGGGKAFHREKSEEAFQEGETGSFIWAGPLDDCGLGREYHWILPTWERDSYRTSPFWMACKGECCILCWESWSP